MSHDKGNPISNETGEYIGHDMANEEAVSTEQLNKQEEEPKPVKRLRRK